MFIIVLFTIAKTWKQPKYPSTKGWIKKMWYVYTMEYYSAMHMATLRDEILAFKQDPNEPSMGSESKLFHSERLF